MIIKIQKLAKEAKIKSSDLITRSVGINMFKKIQKTFDIIHPGEVLILDFSGIRVIDASFVDEFIVPCVLRSREETGRFYVKLKNITETAQINIDSVFKTYSNYNDTRIVVCTEDLSINNNFFIGDLTMDEEDLFNFIRINRLVNCNDLLQYTGSSESGIKKLITGLENLGIIRLNNDNTICLV